jgi:OmpA-OmpF porin, OOP family
MRTVLILLISICIHSIGNSQNLVKNPSLEDKKHCVDYRGSFGHNVEEWTSPTLMTTDYFHTCNYKDVKAPENHFGYQYAADGNGYTGMFIYAPQNYREYIQGVLTDTLEYGRTYELSFHISLAEESKFAIRAFSYIVTERQIHAANRRSLNRNDIAEEFSDSLEIHEISQKTYHTDTAQWIEIKQTFVATGGEKYFTIGNFDKNRKTKRKKVNRKAIIKAGYYYLDMVTIKPVSEI